jgi:type III secretory pathway component EscV
MAEAGGNLILSLILIRWLGILGVAIGTLIPTLLFNLGFVYPHVSRSLHVRLGQTLSEVLLPQVLPALAAAALSLALARVGGSPTMVRLLAEAAAIGTAYWVLFLRFGLSAQERGRMRQALGGMKKSGDAPTAEAEQPGAAS